MGGNYCYGNSSVKIDDKNELINSCDWCRPYRSKHTKSKWENIADWLTANIIKL